jgi:hypothetical protein
LRNMVVLLESAPCVPWRGLIVSVLPIAHQSHRFRAGFEKTTGGSATIS